MTKHEFLSELRTALEGNIPSQEVEENIRYYDSYFSESSKTEREVCEELGDPRLIARSLIDSFTASKGPMADYYKEQARSEYSRESRTQSSRESSGMEEKWYDKLFRYIMLVAIAIIVGSVLIFLVKVAVTVVIPVIVILLVVKLLVDLFRRY